MTDEQYKAAIKRNLAEVNWARSQWRASDDISKVKCRLFGDEFLGQCMVALKNDMLSHLMKVLDTHRGTASFWSILSLDNEKINILMQELGLSMDIIHTMSSKVRLVRNKTHFHIDKEAVLDPEEIWRSAGIKNEEITDVIETLFKLFDTLYRREIVDRAYVYGYDGQDIGQLFEFAKEKGLLRG